jgi:hypothetical protein
VFANFTDCAAGEGIKSKTNFRKFGDINCEGIRWRLKESKLTKNNPPQNPEDFPEYPVLMAYRGRPFTNAVSVDYHGDAPIRNLGNKGTETDLIGDGQTSSQPIWTENRHTGWYRGYDSERAPRTAGDPDYLPTSGLKMVNKAQDELGPATGQSSWLYNNQEISRDAFKKIQNWSNRIS